MLRPSATLKVFLSALAALLFCAALVRAIAFWAHEPMLAYANNFDQAKAMSFLRLRPALQNTGSPDAATPESPIRYFMEEPGVGYMLYPSSDLVVKAIQLQTAKLQKTPHDAIDIRHLTFPLLALWLAAMGWIAWQIWLASRWHAVCFCGWLALVCDPINLLYLNTLYTEFLTFTAFSIFVGICWLALLRQCIDTGSAAAGLMVLALLATSKEQYMFLPLSFLPLLLIPNFRAALTRRNIVIRLCALATVVAPILIYSNSVQITQAFNAWISEHSQSDLNTVYKKYFNLSELIGHANRVDTAMSAVLPAASKPDQMLQVLALPENCQRFIGENWYTVPYENYQEFCPEVLELPLLRIASALLSQPSALYRMVMNAARQQHCFMASPHLGQVEGAEGKIITSRHLLKKTGDKIQLRSMAARSVNEALYRLPPTMWTATVILTLTLPILLALVFSWKRNNPWGTAMLLLSIVTNYVFFSSILGDGYVDLGRHTVLCFSLGSLLAVLLPCLLLQQCTLPAFLRTAVLSDAR